MVRAPGTPTPTIPKPNDDILLVGLNKGSKDEAAALRARGNNVTYIGDSYEGNDKIRGVGSDRATVYDLSSNAGVDNFVKSLGLPAAQSTEIGGILKGASADARDELGQLARVWANGEKGGKVPSRLMLSGHSGGSSLFGDDNGSFSYSEVQKLAKAMPKAAAQVEDVHLAACYAGSQRNADGFKDAFPNMKTFWGYHSSAPGSASGATTHQARWDTATRGRKDTLDRSIANHTRKGENVATWNVKTGFNDGQPPIALDAQRSIVQNQEQLYQDHLAGRSVQGSPASGPLRNYYNELQRLLRHPQLPTSERPELEARRDQAMRLLYYSQTVAPKFDANYDAKLDAGYAAAGIARPNFGAMSRQDALGAISAFDEKVAAGGATPAMLETQRLLHGLRDLSPAIIPSGWV